MAQLSALPPKRRKYEEPSESPTENARDAARPIVPLPPKADPRMDQTVGAGLNALRGAPGMGAVQNAMNAAYPGGELAPAVERLGPPPVALGAGPESLPVPAAPPPNMAVGVQNQITRGINADTDALRQRGAIVADGTYANAVQRGVDPATARGMFSPVQAMQTAPNLTQGGAPISQQFFGGPSGMSRDARRAFAENQSLSVRQMKAADQRQRFQNAAAFLAHRGDMEGARQMAGQAAAIESPSARTVYDVQREREGEQRQVELARAQNPPRVTGTTTQPRPALSPEMAARVQALLTRMRSGKLEDADRVAIQRELEALLAGESVEAPVPVPAPAPAGSVGGAAGAAGGGGAPKTDFATVQEAEAANLPPGTRITINGRPAIVE